jgi:hypothetical protein
MISLEIENASTLDPRGSKDLVSRVAEWLRVPRQKGGAVRFGEKKKRYASLGFPMIAAAVKHHRAEIDEIDVEDVLLGRLSYVSRETASGKSLGGRKA